MAPIHDIRENIANTVPDQVVIGVNLAEVEVPAATCLIDYEMSGVVGVRGYAAKMVDSWPMKTVIFLIKLAQIKSSTCQLTFFLLDGAAKVKLTLRRLVYVGLEEPKSKVVERSPILSKRGVGAARNPLSLV